MLRLSNSGQDEQSFLLFYCLLRPNVWFKRCVVICWRAKFWHIISSKHFYIQIHVVCGIYLMVYYPQFVNGKYMWLCENILCRALMWNDRAWCLQGAASVEVNGVVVIVIYFSIIKMFTQSKEERKKVEQALESMCFPCSKVSHAFHVLVSVRIRRRSL